MSCLAVIVRAGERMQTALCSRWLAIRRMAEGARGCVKTLKGQQVGELFSLLPLFRSRPQRCSSLDGQNQEGLSTRRLNACVFTQPRPTPAVRNVLRDRL